MNGPKQVIGLLHDNFVARLRVDFGANLVRHGAGGDEQSGFFTQQLGGEILQPVDGGIFAEHIIADLGLGHGPTHFRRGFGNGITTQINHDAYTP